jgi:acetoacetyl-CoA synthetase
VKASKPYTSVLDERKMPGAKWFEGAELNYAEHALRHADERPDEPAIMYQSETRDLGQLTWRELKNPGRGDGGGPERARGRARG